MQRLTTLQRYLVGLSGTLLGAGATACSGSMLPLALGASFSLLCTADVVRRIWSPSRKP